MQQLGAFAAGGVLLRYSRTAETQADISGTQVLYDSGYDPRAMAQFFEKLEADSKGKNPPEFFSDHPSPDHRVERVDQEIERLGGIPPNARRDSQEFEAAKREVMNLPIVKKAPPGGPPPEGRFRSLRRHRAIIRRFRLRDTRSKFQTIGRNTATRIIWRLRQMVASAATAAGTARWRTD